MRWDLCWINLRHKITTGNTSIGKNQLLDLMTDIEYIQSIQEEDNGKLSTTLNTTPSRSH